MLRWLWRLVLGLVVVLAITVAWLWWSNRDLPAAVVDARYGGDDLQRVLIDGVDVAYKVSGDGPPLVLLHSHFYTMRQWQAWVDELADDFTVIRYDLTSHGLTGPDPSGDYSRARGAQLLLGLLDHLQIDQAAVVGSSTGGGIAWTFAAQHPERIAALVLVNAAGMPKTSNRHMEGGLPAWFGHALYLMPEAMFRPFLEAPVIDDSLVTDALLREFHEMYRREGNRMSEFQRMLAWEKEHPAPTLARITAPTLVLWGEANPQLPVAHAGQFRDALVSAPRVEVVTFADIGHVIPLEAPYASAVATRRFLQGTAQ